MGSEMCIRDRYPDYIVAAAKGILFGVLPLSVFCASAMHTDTRFAKAVGVLGYACALAIVIFAVFAIASQTWKGG